MSNVFYWPSLFESPVSWGNCATTLPLRLATRERGTGGGSRRSTSGRYPPANIWVSEGAVTLELEVPGSKLEEFDIHVTDSTLKIGFEHAPKNALGEFIVNERNDCRNNGERTFQLPYRIASDQVEAVYERGLLTITLPRSEGDKAKKIQIKAK